MCQTRRTRAAPEAGGADVAPAQVDAFDQNYDVESEEGDSNGEEGDSKGTSGAKRSSGLLP